MEIAIIGAGNVGRALAGSLGRAGHSVTLSAQHYDHATAVAQDTGARAADSNRSAVQQAAVVMLAVPFSAVNDILAEVGDTLDGKVVIDVTNRLNPDDPGAVLDGSSNAEQIQARAGGARVVKAFNTALAARQADPVVDGVQLDGLVAGGDDAAKRQALELVGSVGFRPIDAGPLSMARALEAMAALNIMLQMWNRWRT
jgi:8-hydroxy-5-deazaflavin:NADPH oxidoreductase